MYQTNEICDDKFYYKASVSSLESIFSILFIDEASCEMFCSSKANSLTSPFLFFLLFMNAIINTIIPNTLILVMETQTISNVDNFKPSGFLVDKVTLISLPENPSYFIKRYL